MIINVKYAVGGQPMVLSVKINAIFFDGMNEEMCLHCQMTSKMYST